jgi:hypothetical protein
MISEEQVSLDMIQRANAFSRALYTVAPVPSFQTMSSLPTDNAKKLMEIVVHERKNNIISQIKGLLCLVGCRG